MRKGTREAVIAWREAEAKSARVYETNGQEAHAAIVSAGGWVTTSPDAKGLCQDYQTIGEYLWPGTGVSRSGKRNGDKVAPYRPEIGDRVRTLDKEQREAYFASKNAQAKVAELYADVLGDAPADERTLEILARVVRAMVEAE
jgi:hypothetical protein